MSEQTEPTKQSAAPVEQSDRKATPKRPAKRRVVTKTHAFWYHLCQGSLYVFIKLGFRIQYVNSKNVPKKGATLLVANHQSFLDPPAIGCGYFRATNFLARKTLFKFKPFGKLIDSVDAIPLETEGLGFQGIKETLRRLKNDEAVLIFPEGQRCYDGEIAPFTSGYVTLATRSSAAIVPVAIAGAFEAFPRTRKFPSFFKPRVRVEYGAPILPETYRSMTDEEIHALVVAKIREMYDRIRRRSKNAT